MMSIQHLSRSAEAQVTIQERRLPRSDGRGTRDLSVSPSSYDATARTVEAILSAGSPVQRFYFTEELEISPQAVDLGRVERGICPLLDTHNQHELSAVIGRISNVRFEAGNLIGTLSFSDTDAGRNVEARVAAGELRAISIGYRVTRWQMTEVDDSDNETWRAVAWELLEASLVPVPADPNAVVRSSASPSHGRHEDDDMTRNQPGPPSAPAAPRARRGVTNDRIRELCGRTNDLSRHFERQLMEDHADEPLSEREMLARISDELIRVREQPGVDTRRTDVGTHDRRNDTRQHFADALFSRLTGRPAPDAAREYRNASLVQIARHMLETNGERVRWMRDAQVVDQLARAGAHTTSDFAYVINSAGARYLLDAYSNVASPLKAIARKRDFPDFKMRYGVQAEGPSFLRNVKENAEFKRVSFSEGQNGATLGTYGEIFQISRQALINDDLNVFADMAAFWARAQTETEASYLTALIAGTGTMMGDGKALYHADHKNIAAAAAAITVASLSAARAQLRAQTNRDGQTLANVVPKYLVVGPAKETEAEQALASLAARTPANVNPFSGKLDLVVDPRLPGLSWRLFADPALSPVLEYGNLEGQDGLFTDTRLGFEVDGVEFKARTDIGAGAIDYRGTLLNPGA